MPYLSIFAFLKTVIFRYFPFTSYVKLQDAFVNETGNAYGSWNIIGYLAPGQKENGNNTAASGSTNNFSYAQAGSYDATKETAALTGTGTSVWVATSTGNLNDCDAGSTWTIQISKTKDAAAANYNGAYSDATNCKALTPQFANIGK